MKNDELRKLKTDGTVQNTDKQTKRRDQDTKPCKVVYDNGDEFDARHHIVTDSVVHVYAGPKHTGITRTIPLSSVRHILRGGAE